LEGVLSLLLDESIEKLVRIGLARLATNIGIRFRFRLSDVIEKLVEIGLATNVTVRCRLEFIIVGSIWNKVCRVLLDFWMEGILTLRPVLLFDWSELLLIYSRLIARTLVCI